MKALRIGALAFALFATAGVVHAQDTTRAQRGHGAKAGHMAHDLGLTEAQRAQIRAIHEKYRPQMQQLNAGMRTHVQAAAEARQRGDTAAARAYREQARAAMEQTRTQREQLHNQMQAELRAVLTPEQQAKADARRAEMQERREMRREMRGTRGGQRGGGIRGQRGPGARGERPFRGGRSS